MFEPSVEPYLAKVLEGLGPVTEQPGHSGYFSEPETTLDPNLFDGTNLKGEVRNHLLSTFYAYFGERYSNPRKWSTLWLAGSGISYQWSADRGNGDLDVLIGINFPEFFYANPDYQGISEVEMGDLFNRALKTDLWPKTAATKFGDGTYEVTFYINPHAEDIRTIHPYAAYDVSNNSWTVKPPVLGSDREAAYPKEYWEQVENERARANTLLTRYNTLSNNLRSQSPSGPGWTNSLSMMSLIVDQAKSLFDDIHLGRKNAFGPNGEGYGDFFNFRWQAHKKFGTIQALDALSQARVAARDSMETDLYGHPIKSAEAALDEAALWNKHMRGLPT